MLTHANLPFTAIRKIVQDEAEAVGAVVSNRRSKVLAQAIINATSREEWHHNPDSYRTFMHSDPVGEKVVRRVMAAMAGYEPEPI